MSASAPFFFSSTADVLQALSCHEELHIPTVHALMVEQWRSDTDAALREIMALFSKEGTLAVRSSCRREDSESPLPPSLSFRTERRCFRHSGSSGRGGTGHCLLRRGHSGRSGLGAAHAPEHHRDRRDDDARANRRYPLLCDQLRR